MLICSLGLGACDLGIQVGRVGGGTTAGPEVTLGSQTGPTTVQANDPTQCEVDVNFGNVPIGVSDMATLQIENLGGAPLQLSPIDPTLDPEFTLSFGTQPAIPPGDFGRFTVSFEPYKTGAVTSTFTVPTNGVNPACLAQGTSDGGSVVTVALLGTGIELSLVVQPDSLDFGNVLLNTTKKLSVTLTNKSTATMAGIMATVTGTDASLFTVDNAPQSLGAFDSATVDITYAPLALETRSIATVVFSASDGETVSLMLYGEPVGVALTLAPNPINFGYEVLQTNAVGCTVATNQSNVPVSITGTQAFENEGGAFSVATTDDATPPNPFSLPITIQGGANAKVCFSFLPPISQQYAGQVTLTTNDPSGENPVVSLVGWGGGPQIGCVPTSLAFGTVDGGETATQHVLCTNMGTAIPGVNLLIEPPTASPAVFSAQFDPTNDPYPLGGLEQGHTTQIDVRYSPTGVSDDKGTLFIKSNGGQGQTIQIPLTGQGAN